MISSLNLDVTFGVCGAAGQECELTGAVLRGGFQWLRDLVGHL